MECFIISYKSLGKVKSFALQADNFAHAVETAKKIISEEKNIIAVKHVSQEKI